jgi:hypothetical protein
MVVWMAALAGAALAGAALSGAACSNDTPVTYTDCVASYPDGGTPHACSIEWTCASGSQHFELDCDLKGSNYSCLCSTDTSLGTTPIAVPTFKCDGFDALSPATTPSPGGCGWMIQLAASQ